MISIAELKRLEAERNELSLLLREGLQERWPEGSIIRVFLNCKQVNPSEGEVVNYSGSKGTVRVRLTKPNKRGDRHVVDVGFEKCMS